jgi:hypothetical protein
MGVVAARGCGRLRRRESQHHLDTAAAPHLEAVMLTRENKIGLVLAFLLGLADIAFLAALTGDSDDKPPVTIVVLSVIVGLVTLVLGMAAWRTPTLAADDHDHRPAGALGAGRHPGPLSGRGDRGHLGHPPGRVSGVHRAAPQLAAAAGGDPATHPGRRHPLTVADRPGGYALWRPCRWSSEASRSVLASSGGGPSARRRWR